MLFSRFNYLLLLILFVAGSTAQAAAPAHVRNFKTAVMNFSFEPTELTLGYYVKGYIDGDTTHWQLLRSYWYYDEDQEGGAAAFCNEIVLANELEAPESAKRDPSPVFLPEQLQKVVDGLTTNSTLDDLPVYEGGKCISDLWGLERIELAKLRLLELDKKKRDKAALALMDMFGRGWIEREAYDLLPESEKKAFIEGIPGLLQMYFEDMFEEEHVKQFFFAATDLSLAKDMFATVSLEDDIGAVRKALQAMTFAEGEVDGYFQFGWGLDDFWLHPRVTPARYASYLNRKRVRPDENGIANHVRFLPLIDETDPDEGHTVDYRESDQPHLIEINEDGLWIADLDSAFDRIAVVDYKRAEKYCKHYGQRLPTNKESNHMVDEKLMTKAEKPRELKKPHIIVEGQLRQATATERNDRSLRDQLVTKVFDRGFRCVS